MHKSMKRNITIVLIAIFLIVAVVLFLIFHTRPLGKRIAYDLDYRVRELKAAERLWTQKTSKSEHRITRIKEAVAFFSDKQNFKLPYMHNAVVGPLSTEGGNSILANLVIVFHEEALDVLGVVIYWEEDGQENSVRLPVINFSYYKNEIRYIKENRVEARHSTRRQLSLSMAIGAELSYDDGWGTILIPPDLLINGFEIAVYDNKDNVSNRIKPFISSDIEWELKRAQLIVELQVVESFDEFEMWRENQKYLEH